MRTLNELRDICASLPHSQETFPFDLTTLVFKVGGKMYALTSIDADQPSVSLKVNPEYGEELRAQYDAIVPGYHLNKRHWVTVQMDGSVPDELVRELVTGSYALVVKGLPRAQRAELGL